LTKILLILTRCAFVVGFWPAQMLCKNNMYSLPDSPPHELLLDWLLYSANVRIDNVLEIFKGIYLIIG
jgi:hypothetical protein